MPKIRRLYPHLAWYVLPLCCLCCTLPTRGALGQASQSSDETIQTKSPDPVEAIKRDSNGSDDSETALPSDLERVVKAHSVQAIPTLEQMFDQRRNDAYKPLAPDLSTITDEEKYNIAEHHLDQNDAAHIASALVRLGVKDDTYWSYLTGQVRLALDYNPPYPLTTGPDGKLLPGPSPEFVAWTKAHNTTVEAAVPDAMVVFPAKVLFLALTGDPRGIPLLRQALLSPNYLIQSYAAIGLAKLQDNDSVPLIIAACKRTPAQERTSIATALVFFNDPQALAYAELALPGNLVRALLEAKAQGYTPYN